MEPVNLFNKLFNEEVVALLITKTGRYARQRNDHQFTLTKTDLYKFLGILFLTGYQTGYHSLPRKDLYWSIAEDVSVPLVGKVMSRFKFRQYLHAANIETLNKSDNISKLRPLFQAVNKSLPQFGVFATELSVDEQMVPYFRRRSCKMFIKGKPICFGYRHWAL